MRRACTTYAPRPTKPSTSVATATSTGTRWRPSVEKPNIASASPSPASAKPTQSSGGGGSRMSGMKRFASRIPSTPIGRLIRKIQRQWKYVVMKPPSGGPTTGPTSAGIVSHESACTSSLFGTRAEQHEAADRHHHRAAHALHEPRRDERAERAARGAADRAEQEHRDRGHERRARAETVRDPAADRDEHRERQQVRRERKLQRDRVGREIRRDRGQRGREHGRVHVLDEQGTSDDQREKPVESHRVGSSGELARSMRLEHLSAGS